MCFMSSLVGYKPYRTEFVEHAVPVRCVGPDGRQHRHLSRAYSRIWNKQPNQRAAKRFIHAHVWSLNVAYERFPDAADRFIKSVAGCREVQDGFIAVLKVNSSEAKERDGSMWLQPKGPLYNKVSDALMANGMVTEALISECYGGQDPSKIDKHLSRLSAGPGIKIENGRYSSDVDRRLRLRSNVDVAPRYDDPCFYERLVEGLEATGASGAIKRICGVGRFAGGRSCMILPLTLHDILVMPKQGRVGMDIPSPNKGSKGDRLMTMIPTSAEMAAIFGYIDGERARLSGISLAELKLIAADKRRRHELKRMPLFTEDGVRHVKYMRLYRVFRRAAEHAGLWVDDEEYRTTGRRRYVSFHYLRHEYVHRRLDEVMAMPTSAERIAGRKAIIQYMMWSSGAAMLEWYSAHHVVKQARNAAEKHNDRCDVGVGTIANSPEDSAVQRGWHEAQEMLDGLA